MSFVLALVVSLIGGWALFCALIVWCEGWTEARRDLRDFHAFIVRPWRHRNPWR